MNYSTDQVLNGLISYADNDVMKMLPTSGKWIVGSLITIMTSKVSDIANELSNNDIVKMLHIVDDEGCWDIDTIAKALIENASKYGKINFDIPFVGTLAMTADDIEHIKHYIERKV